MKLQHSIPVREANRASVSRRDVPDRGAGGCGPLILGLAILAVCQTAAAQRAGAQTFQDASLRQLDAVCSAGGASVAFVPIDPSSDLCTVATAGGATSSGIGSFTTPVASLAVQERLRTAREGAQEGTGGGASPDVFGLGEGWSVFVSAGAEQLNHHNNKFEDGYDSQIPTVTAGIDYQVTPWLVAGFAFNYFNSSGDYDDGGSFNTNSYGPLAYASLLPFENAFADITLGYARKDYYRTRRGFITSAGGTAGGRQRGGTDGDELSTSLLLGYDHPIESITIGPRVGLNYVYRWIADYREHGTTGLELRYSGQDESTLQSTLGAVATMAVSTELGVILPQVSASWVHDFAVGGRTIDARFLGDPTGTQFSFKREQTARDFAVLGLGVSAALPNQMQPFVNFETVQGNENLVSYGGVIGLRVGL